MRIEISEKRTGNENRISLSASLEKNMHIRPEPKDTIQNFLLLNIVFLTSINNDNAAINTKMYANRIKTPEEAIELSI